jgi:hypothetical protein
MDRVVQGAEDIYFIMCREVVTTYHALHQVHRVQPLSPDNERPFHYRALKVEIHRCPSRIYLESLPLHAKDRGAEVGS